MKIAEAYESTQKTVLTIKGDNSASQTVNHVETNYKKQHARYRGRSFSDSRNAKPQSSSNYRKESKRSCPGCGVRHTHAQCPMREAECRICKIKGHISSVCWQSRKGKDCGKDKIDQILTLKEGGTDVARQGKQFFAKLLVN